MVPYFRPSRKLVADYYAEYPKKAGIADSLYPCTIVTNVERAQYSNGFNFLVSVRSKTANSATAHVIRCRNLVLATGIFSHRIPPPQMYKPFLRSHDMTKAKPDPRSDLPILVVGSGYTAADVILSHQNNQSFIHVYRWQPEVRPSPLRGCHPQAYPGYAKIYRYMKDAAMKKPPSNKLYEGLPNANVIDISPDGIVRIVIPADENDTGSQIIERKIADIRICIGRRGRLDYLAPEVCKEIGIKNIEAPTTPDVEPALIPATRKLSRSHHRSLHPTTSNTAGKVWIQHSSLRERVEENIEVAPNVFIIGSLTGDSLVRFALGGCVYSAGRILAYSSTRPPGSPDISGSSSETSSISGGQHMRKRPKSCLKERLKSPGGNKCLVS